MAKKTGRPTDYSDSIIELATEYRDNLPQDEVVHSIEGLALYVGVSRATLYTWRNDEEKQEFLDIFDDILALQAKSLLNGGLKNVFNSTITKVMLTKHGYREGIENTGEGGGPIRHDISAQLDKVYGRDTIT